MPSNRILLLGANGQIGQTLRAAPLPAEWQLSAPFRAELDITNHAAVRAAVDAFKPDLIVNSAAFTNVDAAEADHKRAFAVNFEALANLAALCAARDLPIIHLSTDYVFDGTANRPYCEDDQMCPLGAYGESKMLGEEALRQEFPWHVILRVSLVFGPFGQSSFTRMLAAIDAQDEIKIPDIKTGPTAATEISKALIVIANAILTGKHDGFGTFHLCGTPEASRPEFMQAIMEAYAPYTQRRPKIIVTTESGTGSSLRPPYSTLDCSKIKRVYGIEQKPWREGLAEAMGILMRDRKKAI